MVPTVVDPLNSECSRSCFEVHGSEEFEADIGIGKGIEEDIGFGFFPVQNHLADLSELYSDTVNIFLVQLSYPLVGFVRREVQGEAKDGEAVGRFEKAFLGEFVVQLTEERAVFEEPIDAAGLLVVIEVADLSVVVDLSKRAVRFGTPRRRVV